jgi:FkbM family methyltransferase
MNIPIVVICYNNCKYLQNTLAQILKINKKYYDNIIILNNASTCLDTIDFLKNTELTIIENENSGPWISPDRNAHIYNALPDKYVLTDPDLQFNENLPSNFIEIMSELTDKYEVSKIGFALDISDYDKMYTGTYAYGKTIYDWEIAFWNNKLNDQKYELYASPVDTTFAVYNKNYIHSSFHLRIAGDYTAKHLPWYKCNDKCNPVYNVYENYEICNKTTEISTSKQLILDFIKENYIEVRKNDELFLIENNNNNPNLSFWRDTYSNWEQDTFFVFDKILQKDKVFIDIGGWIGTTSMYGSRKSKHVYSIEADNKSIADMQTNLQTNCVQNYTLINKAIYNVDNVQVKFGKNKFLNDSKMNDSTSQIYNNEDSSNDFYLAETITLTSIIKKYQIEPNTMGLIKVDIEGGEENILDELFYIHKTYNVPLYISFHYSWWNNLNLDRFDFLSADTKNQIIAYPFVSIVFN